MQHAGVDQLLGEQPGQLVGQLTGSEIVLDGEPLFAPVHAESGGADGSAGRVRAVRTTAPGDLDTVTAPPAPRRRSERIEQGCLHIR
ncbi:hypothetical protein MPSYJ_14430 [Mycolicibacterium psychrotolerans]|uniref:Uncharacterized protein n=1 Tax=Mycolicibacterium psychrotolerans TaxID=216929 RepID=A0A7I7M874_9MYCO|nr:hypothetical protein MPSYJ_14430 [Mycolicibacterium psychrotolerans]